MDFGNCDVDQWRKALSDYALHIDSKLEELDKHYTQTLPLILQARNPTSYITKEELKKIMEWKLSRGKWRPRLLNFVSAADEEEVKKTSEKAFAALPDLKEAVTALCVVKGVGPATASAVLAAYAPQIAPFMSDEAMVAVHERSNDYSLKRYLAFAEKLQNKAKELNNKAGFVVVGDNGFFTPSDIERALWSAAMGAKKRVDASDSNKRKSTKESDGKTKRKKNPKIVSLISLSTIKIIDFLRYKQVKEC